MNRAEAVAELRNILDDITSGKDDELSQIVAARDEVIERYQPLFSEPLSDLTAEDFRLRKQ
jgi:F420-dependent methylenetetrahydromethanopterin dehydrogenase